MLIIITGYYLVINTVTQLIYIFAICINKYFDDYFYVWYALFIIPLIAAAAMMMIFLMGYEEIKNRAYIPHAFVAAAVSNLLSVIWIVVYI